MPSGKQVTRGQPLSGNLSADAWNRLTAMLRGNTARAKQGRVAQWNRGRDSSVVMVRNNSGSAVDRFEVLGINTPIVSYSQNADTFQDRAALNCSTPSESHYGQFCITIEPIANGEIGRAVVSGVVQAKVTMPDGAAGWLASDAPLFADVTPGDRQVLQPCLAGNARVLWINDAAGTTGDACWALVCIGTSGDPCFVAELTSTEPAGATYDWAAVDLPLTSTADTKASELNGRTNMASGARVMMFWPVGVVAPVFDANFDESTPDTIPNGSGVTLAEDTTWDIEQGLSNNAINRAFVQHVVTRWGTGDPDADELPALVRRLITVDANGQRRKVGVEDISLRLGVIVADAVQELVFTEGTGTTIATWKTRKAIYLDAGDATEHAAEFVGTGLALDIKVASQAGQPGGFLGDVLVPDGTWLETILDGPVLKLNHIGPSDANVAFDLDVVHDADVVGQVISSGASLSFTFGIAQFDLTGHKAGSTGGDPSALSVWIPQVLDDLADVVTSGTNAPAEGDVLTYTGGVWVPAPPGAGNDVLVKVTSADTTADYLNPSITVDGQWIAKAVANAGGDEKLHLYHIGPSTAYPDLDQSVVTTLSADGTGGVVSGVAIIKGTDRLRFDFPGHYVGPNGYGTAQVAVVPQILDDLADVDVSSPASNDMIRWSGTAWIIVTPVTQAVVTKWRYDAATNKFQIKTRDIITIAGGSESAWTDVADGDQPTTETAVTNVQVDGANYELEKKTNSLGVLTKGTESGWTVWHTGQDCSG
jgi:hypothetical protein